MQLTWRRFAEFRTGFGHSGMPLIASECAQKRSRVPGGPPACQGTCQSVLGVYRLRPVPIQPESSHEVSQDLSRARIFVNASVITDPSTGIGYIPATRSGFSLRSATRILRSALKSAPV
jgi:hypothetical protein